MSRLIFCPDLSRPRFNFLNRWTILFIRVFLGCASLHGTYWITSHFLETLVTVRDEKETMGFKALSALTIFALTSLCWVRERCWSLFFPWFQVLTISCAVKFHSKSIWPWILPLINVSYLSAFILAKVGGVLSNRFERTGSMKELEWAIAFLEQAVNTTPKDHPNCAMHLSFLGNAYRSRFEWKGSMEDLERAINFQEQTVDIIPKDDLNSMLFFYYLGKALLRRFEWTGSMEDLKKAILLHEQAVDTTPKDNPNCAMYSNGLGNALWRLFERTGSMETIERAIVFHEQAVNITPEDHPNRAMYSNGLGNAVWRLFERTTLIEDLERAIAFQEHAVNITQKDHPNRAMYSSGLGNALWRRFEQTGSMNDLERAIIFHEQAVNATPKDHTNWAMYANGLGNALWRLFERNGSMEDLVRAITIFEGAVDSSPKGHPNLAMYYNGLGNVQWCLFERTGLMEDLEKAITSYKQAVNNTSKDHPNCAMYSNGLGNGMWCRFERTGLIEDLEKALTLYEEAVDKSSKDHLNRALYSYGLGNALSSRFEWTGLMEDLERAISSYEQAAKITPKDNPSHALYTHGLGNALESRFERTESMEDLERAIDFYNQAVNTTPKDHRNCAMYFSSLGNAFESRFERTGFVKDIEQAISLYEQAINITPKDHPDRALYSNGLGNALSSRFEQTGLMEDLEQAFTFYEQAVDTTPEGHPDRAAYSYNLGNALKSHSEESGSIEDLKHAIIFYEDAVNTTPKDHPDCAMYFNGLGSALSSRSERTGSTEDLEQAISCYEQAAQVGSAPPTIRIRAAHRASLCLVRNKYWDRANYLLTLAVELMPITAPHSLNPLDRQFILKQFAGISSHAVSVSIQCGKFPSSSLQLWELGNGILASLQLQVRSDIVDLEEAHPEMARKFRNLRDQLDVHSNIKESRDKTDEVGNNRRNIAKELEKQIEDIRQLPEFQNFLRVPTEADLKALAVSGPIVVFNISDIRSDALIVMPEDVHAIPLPLLQHSDLHTYTTRFLDATRTVGRPGPRQIKSRKDIHKVLEWLWDVAVGCILDHLGLTEQPEHWVRIWWVGNDLLSVLPIHAAGYHRTGTSRTAVDRVISSYTPTLKALKYARERSKRASIQLEVNAQKTLLIGWPDHSAEDGLQFVSGDIPKLESMLSPSVQTTVLQTPDRDSVLERLPDYHVVHFSCHGYSSASDPSQSRLLLKDWKDRPLTVSDLTTSNISCGQFAFLSACHSASLGHKSKHETVIESDLLSESISLSSATQLAGYPSVIGTLWEVRSDHSEDIANEVYSGMLVGNKLETERSAEVLHHAVRRLRDRTKPTGFSQGLRNQMEDDPLQWAPFIHIGV